MHNFTLYCKSRRKAKYLSIMSVILSLYFKLLQPRKKIAISWEFKRISFLLSGSHKKPHKIYLLAIDLCSFELILKHEATAMPQNKMYTFFLKNRHCFSFQQQPFLLFSRKELLCLLKSERNMRNEKHQWNIYTYRKRHLYLESWKFIRYFLLYLDALSAKHRNFFRGNAACRVAAAVGCSGCWDIAKIYLI